MSLADKAIEIYDKLDQAGITRWPIMATALSYYCVLGLVPFLALCFAVAKSFGLEAALNSAITDFFATFKGQEKIMAMAQDIVENLLANYSGSLMAFVAVALIFWSGYRVLVLLEVAFGKIFGYHPPRRTITRVQDYGLVIIVMPFILVAAGGVNIFLAGLKSATWANPFDIDPSGFISALAVILPYAVWWLALSWVYAYFSRGLMRWRERLLGGLATGVVFQLFQTFYLRVMFALSSYNAIYGSFAAIPLFLIWLYAAWTIVLGGGELTRRLSDRLATGRHFATLVEPATWRRTEDLALAAVRIAVAQYQAEPVGGAVSFRQLSRETGADMPSLGEAINRLICANLLARVSGGADDEGPCFIPARAPEQLSDAAIREALETGLMEII